MSQPDDTHHDGPSTPPLPQIPGFETLAVVGQGGLRTIYQARRCGTGEVVALSVTRPWSDPPEDDPCWRSASIQAWLSHPHVERLFEHGRHEDLRYLVTEYHEGGDLQARLRDGGPLPPRDAAALLAVVARAVHYLHVRGVLHRNLKPRNVLFAADGTPRVGGFGLALGKTDRDGWLPLGMVAGTPGYLAPEQARGECFGPAADVYALGVVLYECLTGRTPFSGSAMELLHQAINAQPAPPRQIRPAIPAELEAVCLRCLGKDPARRPASAEALADELERCLAAPA